MAGQVNKRKDKDRIYFVKENPREKMVIMITAGLPEMANAILCMLRHWKNCGQRKRKFYVINVMA